MRVIVCDDHAIVRDGIRLMLSLDPSFEVVGEAADGVSLLALLQDVDADVIVLDLQLGGMGGLAVLEELMVRPDAPPVVVLTMHDDDRYLRRSIELGARGYVLKRSGREALVTALRVVAAGGAHVDPHLAASLVGLARSGGEPLTLTEDATRLLKLLCEGLQVAEMATVTGWGEGVVRSRIRSLYRALGVHRRADAVAMALRMHLVD